MVSPIQNFTETTLDSEGHNLIGSNQVLDIFYYDSSGESWRRDYSTLANPFVNYNFAATVTGTSPGPGWYETGSDVTAPPTERFFKISKFPFDYESELLSTYGTLLTSTPVSNGAAAGVSGDFFITAGTKAIPKNTFPINYDIAGFDGTDRWATTSGIPSTGRGQIAWQLTPSQQVAGFYLDSYDADETTPAQATAAAIGNYQIQVGNTGTGLSDADYVTIASGTLPVNWIHPLWVEVPPTTAKYVRILFRNNGSTVRSGLGKVFAYSKAVVDTGMALVVTRVMGISQSTIPSVGKTFALNQIVDLTGLDKVYFDVKDYCLTSSNQFEVFVNGIKKVDFQVPNDLSANDVYNYCRGVSVDVAGFGSSVIFQVSKAMSNNPINHSGFLSVTNFTAVPGWFTELSSAVRGSKKDFPQRSLIVVDANGVSIIDADTMVLWMRFNLGTKKMIQQRPHKVLARNGLIYFATFRGLYVIDFSGNRTIRIDERGIWGRYGIDYRNENCFDFEEWTESAFPSRILLDYVKLASNSFPDLGINDIAIGSDQVFGDYLLAGTNKGLVVYDCKFDATAAVVVSLDKSPVSKVTVVNGSIWYLQGEGANQVVNYISSINSASSNDFVPERTYYKFIDRYDSLAQPLDSDYWEIVNQDPSMHLIQGSILTISGSRSRGGSTGLISSKTFGDRSFVAKVKVKLAEFPADARGAVRFGLCSDYKHLGIKSLESDAGFNSRSGFFISAFNSDPYGWPLFNSSPLLSDQFEDEFFYVGRHPGGYNTITQQKIGTPTISGTKLKSYGITNSSSSNALVRMSSVQPVLARDFTAKLMVQLESGFGVPTQGNTNNPNAWFGISRNSLMIPGSTGTGNVVDAAMLVTGNTTFSGVLVYTVGNYSSTAAPSSLVMIQPRRTLASGESTGHSTSPYREWRVDYDHGLNTLNCFIDGLSVGSIQSTSYTNPNRIGLCFGVGLHGVSPQSSTRSVFYKELKVEYPTLVSGSRGRYGLEVTDGNGSITQVMANVTASGMSRNSDLIPASGILSTNMALSDGSFNIGAIVAGANVSFGLGFSKQETVESLNLYDISMTSGWDNTSAKRVDVWHSSDNVSWIKHKSYDLNAQERVSGLTKLRFSPAIYDKYVKIHCLDSVYAIPGGGNWSISEVNAQTASGIGFFASDKTAGAQFHEWSLQYDASSKHITGFIDGVLVSSGIFSGELLNARFVLTHDLSTVTSGIDSNFYGEFKDFEIVFSGTGYVSPGEVTALSVNHNTLVGGNSNYTLFTGSTENVTISDFDYGFSPVEDLVRSFDHGNQIFGATKKVSAITPDTEAHRSTGLVFVGTNTLNQSKYRVLDRRPIWFENWGGEGLSSGDEALKYGAMYTFVFHPAKQLLLIIHDRNSTYYTVVNLKTREWRQLTREYLQDIFGFSGSGTTAEFQRSSAKGVYSSFDDKVWIFVSPDSLYGLDVETGQVVRGIYDTTEFEDVSYRDFGVSSPAGRWFIAYLMHNHRLVFGYDYIGIFDLNTMSALPHPRRFADGSSQSLKWNRSSIVPWNSGLGAVPANNGIASAVYCDYDKCVYFIGSPLLSIGSNNYFYRYDPDKDYLDLLSDGNELRSWPAADALMATQTPVSLTTHKACNLIYDSRRRRIYLIAQRGVKAQLSYYDVVTQKWVETANDPPFTSLRKWPSAEPTRAADTNFMAYNPQTGTIYLANGRGDASGAYIYEYFPEETAGMDLFDYLPSRDGFPTTSGLSRQYTTFSGVIGSNYYDLNQFNRDFYFTDNSITTTSQRFAYTFNQSGIVTVSGFAGGGAAEAQELYVSSVALDSHHSFDLTFKAAFPRFTRNITNNTASRPANCFFRMGVGDGLNRPWVFASSYGEEDPNLYQAADIRVGVSGTLNDSVTQFPLVAHISYTDGFNTSGDTSSSIDPKLTYDTYLSGGLNLGSAPISFQDFRLSYTYETDLVEGFMNGSSIGSTTLRRKFSDNGLRFYLGFTARSSSGSQVWVAQVKDIKISPKAWDRIEGGRLVTSISGSVGSYIHERWDSTLVSGTSWVYEIDAYVPVHRRFTGYDYVGTFGGIGDGRKLAELVFFNGPDQVKMVGFLGDLSKRHDRDSYLSPAESLWDDNESGIYRIVRDISTDQVSVYINGSTESSITVPYDSLPSYNFQHVYYGKVHYGDFERVYENPTLSGTWTDNPNYTGTNDPLVKKLAFNSTAKFATISQGFSASAKFELEPALGDVDLYTFHHASGFDSVKDAPFTITSSGAISLPLLVGLGHNVVSIADQTNEFGTFDPNKITIRVDQRRVKGSNGTSTDKNFAQASGWIYLGRFRNPSRVVITAQASVGTTSTAGFVCVDAIGVNIGEYGKSTFDMNIGRVRYVVGSVDLPEDVLEPSGLTVVDLSSNSIIDAYGETTAPAVLDGDIVVGKVIGS